HFCAISMRSWCQVDPCGASVPSLMRTGAACAVAVTNKARTRARMCMELLFNSVRQDVAFVREQEARASLRDLVLEPLAARVGLVDVESQRFAQERLELLAILRRSGDGFGIRDQRGDLLPLLQLPCARIVGALLLGRGPPRAGGIEGNGEFVQRAEIEGLVERQRAVEHRAHGW